MEFQPLRLDLYAKSEMLMIFCQKEIPRSALCQFSRTGGWSVAANFLHRSIKTYLMCAKKRARVIEAFLIVSHRVLDLRV